MDAARRARKRWPASKARTHPRAGAHTGASSTPCEEPARVGGVGRKSYPIKIGAVSKNSFSWPSGGNTGASGKLAMFFSHQASYIHWNHTQRQCGCKLGSCTPRQRALQVPICLSPFCNQGCHRDDMLWRRTLIASHHNTPSLEFSHFPNLGPQGSWREPAPIRSHWLRGLKHGRSQHRMSYICKFGASPTAKIRCALQRQRRVIPSSSRKQIQLRKTPMPITL